MGVIISAAGCAINAALYADDGHWYNLAAAIFCGLMTIAILVQDS